MIKITLADGKIKEVYNMLDSLRFQRDNRNPVIKVEKQVKDLTSKEIYKIFSSCFGNELDSIEVCEDRIVVNWYDYGEKTYSEYFYDDYIDITKLVVGE